jgi:hypothetical protein
MAMYAPDKDSKQVKHQGDIKMKIAKGNATVAGINFAIFADITKRGMIAVNEATGEEKIIIRSGYATKDLTIRKAVANAFSLPTFRSK